ncbi:MAG: hypothetical protein AAGC81_10645 [Pseudomonadota bacterium]
MRVLCLLFIILLPGIVFAQSGPILRAELEKTEAVPGQPIILRVTVLVPTWFPKPPVFPSFEIPDLMVRLPERASGPVSEQIEGETWSGVSRAYRLYPLTPGEFVIPTQKISLTVADPGASSPESVDLATEEIRFRGVIPAGAEDLDPFIAAEELTVEQEFEGALSEIAPGDAVIRTITAKLAGASPVFLPPLLAEHPTSGLSAYPDEPVLEEKSNRGTLSGKRVERVSYVVQQGGSFELTPISLRWYNLKTTSIETIELKGKVITATAVSAATDPASYRTLLIVVIVLALLAIVLHKRLLRLIGLATSRVKAYRAKYHASELYAFREAKRAVGAKDYAAALLAIDEWWHRAAREGQSKPEHLSNALLPLGATIYSRHMSSDDHGEHWSILMDTLNAARQVARADQTSVPALASLNPVQTSQAS